MVKPWAYIARVGVHSRIRKARQHLVRKQNSRIVVDQYAPLPENSPEHARTLPIPCVPMGIVFALKVLTGETSNFIGTG